MAAHTPRAKRARPGVPVVPAAPVSPAVGGKIPAPWLRGLPPRQRPAGTAGTRGTRGKQPGFPCPTGASPDQPKPSPRLGILRHAGAEKCLRTPKKLRIKAQWCPPQLTLGLLGGNEANLLINWD